MEISKSAIDDLRDFMKSTFSNVAQTVDGLKQAVKKHNGRFAHYGDRKFVQDKMNEMEAKNGGNENAWIYSTDVINDLNKIKFGKSNIDSGWGELDAPGFRPGFDELDEENGLTVVWAAACGRGEWPVAFAVYVDNHKHLRAYIPEKGNVFDAKNKCALMKGTPQTYDMEAMRAQAKARIMVDESTKPKKESNPNSTNQTIQSGTTNSTNSTNTPYTPMVAVSNTIPMSNIPEFIEKLQKLTGENGIGVIGKEWVAGVPELFGSSQFSKLDRKNFCAAGIRCSIGLPGFDDSDGCSIDPSYQIDCGNLVVGPEQLPGGEVIIWGAITYNYVCDPGPFHDTQPKVFAFILYLDNNKTLHAYVPSNGNFYDHQTGLPYAENNTLPVVFDMNAMRTEFLANVSGICKTFGTPNPYNLLNTKIEEIPGIVSGMTKVDIKELKNVQKKWIASKNPLKDEGTNRPQYCLQASKKELKNWKTFNDIKKWIGSDFFGDYWFNPYCSNVNLTNVDLRQKWSYFEGDCYYVITFFFDGKSGDLLGYIRNVD